LAWRLSMVFIQTPTHFSPLARLIQNGFTDEAKSGETRKTGFSWLLVHFNLGLQNGFTLQCLDLRKIDEAESGISHAKKALRCVWSNLVSSKLSVHDCKNQEVHEDAFPSLTLLVCT